MTRVVTNSSSTDPVGYAYPVQTSSHFNFAGIAINGSIPHGDRKHGNTSAAGAENVGHQSISANGIRLSDYTSTSTSVNGNEKSSQLENVVAMNGRPATTTNGIISPPLITLTVIDEDVTPPTTPAAKRVTDSDGVKTPTFAAGTGSEVQRRRNINRRQRASTPHPA